jgi:hypothetical protein
MKNLFNKGLDLERIDTLPMKYGWKFDLNTKFQLKDGYRRAKWNNKTLSRLHARASAIQYGSVGKDWNEVHSKLAAMVKHTPYDIKVDELVDVQFCFWNYIKKEWWIRETHRYSRPEMSLKKFLNNSSKMHYWRNGSLYVDPITNKIVHITPKGAPPQTRQQIRESYEKRAIRRKSNKNYRVERKIRGVYELKMMNKPDLLKFYTQLKVERKSLLNLIHSKPNEYPSAFDHSWKRGGYTKVPLTSGQYAKRLKNWKVMERWRLKKAAEANIKLPTIQEQIDRLEQGNFTGYFTSNVYLYKIYKECHHFANP